MKKNLLFMMTAAAVFAGCSNSEIVDEKEGGNNNPIDYSDVPVTFSVASNIAVGSVNSRAAVDAWGNTQVAIWGLEKNAAWNTLGGQLFGSTTPAAATIASGGAVSFDNGKKYYYPMSSSVFYSFYACYPAPKSPYPTPTVTSNSITTKYAVDGKTDIMWAKKSADDVNGKSGYNASYFRNSGAAPILEFGHCLTRLDFKAIKGVGFNQGTGTEATTPVAVKSIKILGVPTEATLVVAGANAGTITAGGTTGDLNIYTADTALGSQTGINALILPGEGSKYNDLGASILFPSTTKEYNVSVTLVGVEVDADGKITREVADTETTSVIKITSDDGFALGSRYTINLTIFPLQKVTFGSATITPWGTGNDVNVDVN